MSSLFFVSVKLSASGPRLVSGEGLQGPDSSGETMKIHLENQNKLRAMSPAEIEEERRKLLSQLGEQSCGLDLLTTSYISAQVVFLSSSQIPGWWSSLDVTELRALRPLAPHT